MMKIFLSIIIIIISMVLYFLNNPLTMGLMILIQTLMICLITGMLANTYWFSYILFLTFLGGLLVMFIYVSSITSNKTFKIPLNKNKMLIIINIILMLMIIMMYFNNLKFMNFNFNNEMINLMNNYLFFNNENKLNLSKLYNKQNFLLMLMMIIYLFITLLTVVKISSISHGPLRT